MEWPTPKPGQTLEEYRGGLTATQLRAVYEALAIPSGYWDTGTAGGDGAARRTGDGKMLKIDLEGHRISGLGGDITLYRLRTGKPGTKTAGEVTEYAASYHPTVESACTLLAKRLAAGDQDEIIATLVEYAERFRGAEARISAAIRGETA